MSNFGSAADSYVMNTTITDDVTLARTGNRDAFGRLVQRHQNHVCSLALALTSNVAASEEIAQEVFVSAWLGLGQLQQPSSFLPWLRQLVRRRAADFQRTRYRTHARTAEGEDTLATIADAGQTADMHLLSAEEQTVLEEALDALESEDRELLLLYYREGRSAKDVAALVGISAAAAHKRIERARDRVRADVLERFSDVAERTAPRADFAPNVLALLPGAGAAAKVAASSLGGAQAASAIAKVGLGGKVAALVLGVAQPLAMILVADRYAARELAGPPGEPKKQLLRFRAANATSLLLVIVLPSLISSSSPFESAPKLVRIALLVVMFGLSLLALREVQPRLLRAMAPGPAARETAARQSPEGRRKMIPYAPPFFAIIVLGGFLPEAPVHQALHHPRGGSVLFLLLGATLGVLILVPIQQWGVRRIQSHSSGRAWTVTSLGILLAVCAAEVAAFEAVMSACASLLGG